MDLHGAAFDGRYGYVYCRHCAVGYPGGQFLGLVAGGGRNERDPQNRLVGQVPFRCGEVQDILQGAGRKRLDLLRRRLALGSAAGKLGYMEHEPVVDSKAIRRQGSSGPFAHLDGVGFRGGPRPGVGA